MRANINLCDDRPRTIPLGMVGENNVTELAFDVSPWVREHGSGTVTLLLQRAEDAAAYPVSVVMDGNTAVYTLTAADLQYNGNGRAELVYTVDGKIAKSRVWSTFVRASLDGSGEAPDPWQSWVDEVISAKDAVEEAVATIVPIPGGGTEGQVLAKASDADHDYEWVDQHGGGGGSDGVWLPSVSEDGDISWEKSESETPPTPRNIRGPAGQNGAPGRDGVDGADGADGQNGADGFSPTVTVETISGGHKVTITDADGDHVFNVMDGTGGGGGEPATYIKSASVSGNTLTLTKKDDTEVTFTPTGGEPELFYCEYGVTTFANISDALSDGLFPVCLYDNFCYVYTGISNGYHCFTAVVSTTAYRLYVKTTWGNASMSLGSYSKPSGGIPSSDLASAVQTSLGKADTSLQPSDISQDIETDKTRDDKIPTVKAVFNSSIFVRPADLTDYQKVYTTQTITLAAANWVNGSQTVSVTGVTANSGIQLDTPTVEDMDAFGQAGCFCSAKGAGSLTFTCKHTPTESINLTVVIW